MASTSKNDDSLLRSIRENFDIAAGYWREVYAEGATDVRYATQGPWTKEEITLRAGRPTLVLDELKQYLNSQENAARQNKRAVKVNPQGDGADDQSALMRGGMIRGIEYKSKATQAYVTAYGGALRRSYGYFKLTTDYEPGSFNRIIKVVRIPNPDVIYLDPDAKEADWSDCEWSFEFESMRESRFLKRWPNATVRSFTPDHIGLAPNWISNTKDGKQIQVASYCRLEQGKKKLLLLEDGSTLDLSDPAVEGAHLIKMEDERGEETDGVEMADGRMAKVMEIRTDNDPHVTQYITNGIEILEETVLDFAEIPIIPVFGPEEWISEGSGSRRIFGSMVRGARDAYKGFCYAKSAIVERLGMDPKSPYEGWQGQFNTQTDFRNLGSNPVGFVEFAIIENPNGGGSILDKPVRNLVEPQIGQYETAGESFRRSIQAAMGGTPLPTAAQRQNEKSGVALDRIKQSSDEGSFHFLDSLDRALERAGRMMDAVLGVVYDTHNRQVPFNDEAGEHKTIIANPHDEQGNRLPGFHTDGGDHGVTISTGPSSDSQRDEATDFTNNLIAHPEVLGPAAPKIIALLVKLRNLGPIGDRIADILDPQPGDGMSPAVSAQLQKAQAIIQQLGQELAELKSGDATKRYISDEHEKTLRVLGLIKVDQQDAETRLDQMLGALSDRFDRLSQQHQQLQDQAHERDQQAGAQQHEQSMALQEQQHAKDMQGAQAAQDQQATAQEQAGDAASQSADQQHEATLAQQSQAADAAAQTQGQVAESAEAAAERQHAATQGEAQRKAAADQQERARVAAVQAAKLKPPAKPAR